MDFHDGVRCMLMRGGTSKGAYFVADHLPADARERDDALLRIMGSPDPRQIDGLGGGHPLTSKVAIVSPSSSAEFDVDYLFLQVHVDEGLVSSSQNCGNILAGVGPFAIERGLVEADDGRTAIRIRMLNTGGTAVASVSTPGARVSYEGDISIAGVPGSAAGIVIDFPSPPGEGASGVFPTGRISDEIDGVAVSCVDNGMPVVVMRAADLGVTGTESCEELEANEHLRAKLESIRLQAGPLMGLGDVANQSVPKLTMVAPPSDSGDLSTRTFIPHRCHTSIGVLGAASVAVASAVAETPIRELVRTTHKGPRFRIEHPTGHLDVEVEIASESGEVKVLRTGVVRTARKIFDGIVYPRSDAS